MKKENPLEKIFCEFPGMWHFREKIAGIITPEEQLEIDLRAQTILRAEPKNQKMLLNFLGGELSEIIRTDAEKKEKEKNENLRKKKMFSAVLHEFRVENYCDEVRIEKYPETENNLCLVFYSEDQWERRIFFDRPEILRIVQKNGLDLVEFLDRVVTKVEDGDRDFRTAISDPEKVADFFAENRIESTKN